jgi:hypothetical protein
LLAEARSECHRASASSASCGSGAGPRVREIFLTQWSRRLFRKNRSGSGGNACEREYRWTGRDVAPVVGHDDHTDGSDAFSRGDRVAALERWRDGASHIA